MNSFSRLPKPTKLSLIKNICLSSKSHFLISQERSDDLLTLMGQKWPEKKIRTETLREKKVSEDK